jgi:hypothetical protein
VQNLVIIWEFVLVQRSGELQSVEEVVEDFFLVATLLNIGVDLREAITQGVLGLLSEKFTVDFLVLLWDVNGVEKLGEFELFSLTFSWIVLLESRFEVDSSLLHGGFNLVGLGLHFSVNVLFFKIF